MKHAIQDVLTDKTEDNAPDIGASSLTLKVHPWRSSLYEELHNRPSPIIHGNCQVAHFTVLLNDNREALHEHVVDLCKRFCVPAPGPESSCLYQDFGGFELRWERHLEFSNFTFICPDVEPFSADALNFIPKDWLASLPGELVVAVQMAVIDQPPTEQQRHLWLEGQRASGSQVADSRAEVWTAFKLHNDGFGRIITCNNELTPYQMGRLVQRLFELETYRLMSLMALPVARKLGGELGRIEDGLARLNESISDIEADKDERTLLQELSMLAADVEGHRSNTNFRFFGCRGLPRFGT